MGIGTNFLTQSKVTFGSQHSDFGFFLRVLNAAEEVQATSQFSEVEYLIIDSNGAVVYSTTLSSGKGIIDMGDKYLIKIDDSEFTFHGEFQHQVVVFDSYGNRLPPVLLAPLVVVQTYKT